FSSKALVGQPGGFEGVGVTEPGPRFDALPVAPCVEKRGLLIELDAAGKPDPDAAQAEHLVTKIADIGVLVVTRFGELRQVIKVLTPSCVSTVCPAALRQGFDR